MCDRVEPGLASQQWGSEWLRVASRVEWPGSGALCVCSQGSVGGQDDFRGKVAVYAWKRPRDHAEFCGAQMKVVREPPPLKIGPLQLHSCL